MLIIDDSCNDECIHFKYFVSVLEKIQTGDWPLYLCESARGGFYIQLRFMDKDNFEANCEPCEQFCRKWMIEPSMDAWELVRTAYKAYECASLHEMQEKFVYDGQAIFNPHKDLLNVVQ